MGSVPLAGGIAGAKGALMKALVVTYVLLMPFMSALAPAEWFPLPLVLLMLAMPTLLLRRSSPPFSVMLVRDAGFIAMFALGLFAIPFSPLPPGPKTVNYSAAFLVCYLVFFVGVRFLLTQRKITWADILAASHISLTFLSLATILEFYLASFHGLFFSDIIPFAHSDLTIANLVNDSFKRPRAFSAEPGFTALAFECLWPLAFADFGSRRRGIWRHVLYALGFLLLASAAGMVCVLVAAAVVWAIRVRDVRGVIGFVGIALVVLLPVVSTQVGQDLLWSVIGRKLDILSFDVSDDSDGVTALVRLVTYETGLTLIENFPLGVGWGAVAQAFFQGSTLPINAVLNGSGMLSLFLDIAVGSGLLGLFAFLCFIGVRVRDVFRSRNPHSTYVAVALISVCLHHCFITELQFPFIWFLLALADRIAFAKDVLVASRRTALAPDVRLGRAGPAKSVPASLAHEHVADT
jgi:hypothetical protein